MADNQSMPQLDVEWFRVLYDYGAVGNFRREVNDLLKHVDPRTLPGWPEVCRWGHELMPDEPLFKGAKSKDTDSQSLSVSVDELSDILAESSSLKQISHETGDVRESELAKFHELCGDYFGRKIAQARVYAELDDVMRAAVLLVEVLRKGPKHYQWQVMELLEELDSEIVVAAMNENSDSDGTILSVRNTPKSLGVPGDASERFDILVNEGNRQLLLSQIYIELGDCKNAKAQISKSVRDGEHKNNPLVKNLAEQLGILSDSDSSLQAALAIDDSSDSGVHDLLHELSSSFARIAHDDFAKKLALAYFYTKLQDYDMARKLIIDVMDEGDEKHRVQARVLNKQIKEAAG